MRRPRHNALLATLVVTALPAFAAAEGNRVAFDCEPLAPAPIEDAAPEAPATLRPTFAIAPVKTARDGSGEILATDPEGRTFAGVTASHTGPFAWTGGTVLNTLTIEGNTADGHTLVLWHQLDQAQAAVPPEGQLIKLICEVS